MNYFKYKEGVLNTPLFYIFILFFTIMVDIFKNIDDNYVKFENKIIRIIIDDSSNSWFNANDTADALGYKHPRDVIKSNIDKDEKSYMKNIKSKNKVGSQPNSLYINESGLYNLLLQICTHPLLLL